jgi:hypothetical protein
MLGYVPSCFAFDSLLKDAIPNVQTKGEAISTIDLLKLAELGRIASSEKLTHPVCSTIFSNT